MALPSEDKNPPLCIIITEEFITILLFPFTKDDIDLINAIELIPLHLKQNFGDYDVIDTRVLVLLCLLMAARGRSDKRLDYQFESKKKRNRGKKIIYAS